MDDCTLACGGTIALLADRSNVHMVYATDGRRAPAPELPMLDRISEDLRPVREAEARAAMERIGLPRGNVHFLGLPDGRLRRHREDLRKALTRLVERLAPDRLLIPFRYDRHPDHLAVHDVVTSPRDGIGSGRAILEYFVYHRWRLLPLGDIRRYLPSDALLEVDIREAADTKQAALELFHSQTTRYFGWQSRPNLTRELIEAVSREPETFFRYDRTRRGADVFDGPRAWIRIAHRLEPFLKKHKDRAVALVRRAFRGATPRQPQP
jgi:LmbE family N-acetylglucosaminyl deacetylase